ncbi:TIGR01777 family oxidoreductase [Myxococcota bacterium]|nr:TIGR01777 family oxidoreductase [Myxococcota bacterium]
MPTFTKRSELAVPRDELYAWHARPGAFERLGPPWERAVIESRSGDGIGDGVRLTIRAEIGPASARWEAEHHGHVPGERFIDTQRSGPFARWEHTHRFLDGPRPGTSVLDDSIEYELPLGGLGAAVAGGYVGERLTRMFNFRHARTAADLTRHAAWGGRTLTVAVTGASGLIGGALCPFLSTGGHRVLRLVRRAPKGPDELRWDPEAGVIDLAGLEGVDAIIHLAGENVGEGRWTEARKARILQSRDAGTRLLAQAVAKVGVPRFISASAVGYYGDTGSKVVDESSPLGEGFLAEVCARWEAAAEPAAAAGARVAHARVGVVLSAHGGALAKLLPVYKSGGGGPVGSGEQGFPWVHLDDAVDIFHRLLMDDELSGPVNAVAPVVQSQAEVTEQICGLLNRPSLMPLPAAAVRLGFGQMGVEVLLQGQRVRPGALQRRGYTWRFPTLDAAMRHELGLAYGG